MDDSAQEFWRHINNFTIEPIVCTEKQSEALQRICEEEEERMRERDRRNEVFAKENGFSSFAEYKECEKASWQRRHEAFMRSLEEECARRGITVQHYFAQHPQNQESPVHVISPCSCQGTALTPRRAV